MGSCQSSIRFASKENREIIKQPQAPTSSVKSIPVESGLFLTTSRETIINSAFEFIGTPYCYGGQSTNCFDCSGLMLKIFQNIGKNIPRTASEQYLFSVPITREELKPGDLVFFSSGKRISHVGVYIGNNEIIHSSSSAGVIRQSLDDSYLKKTFSGYGRVID